MKFKYEGGSWAKLRLAELITGPPPPIEDVRAWSEELIQILHPGLQHELVEATRFDLNHISDRLVFDLEVHLGGGRGFCIHGVWMSVPGPSGEETGNS